MAQSDTTIDHDEIRRWAEERDGTPATVKGTGKKKNDAGILRLDFEPKDEELEEISWDEFFEKFDKEGLAFLYQEKTADGKVSRFHKFVQRDADRKASSGSKSSGAQKSGASSKSGSGAQRSSASSKSGSGAQKTGAKRASTASKSSAQAQAEPKKRASSKKG